MTALVTLGLTHLGAALHLQGGLAIENTLNLACEVPCLLVRSVSLGESRELGLVVLLDGALALSLLLGSSSDGVLQRDGSLAGGTGSLGVGSHGRLVGGLGSGVRGGTVEGLALALGEGAECAGAER